MSDKAEVRCLLCSRTVRLSGFPDYFYFWRPWGYWHTFQFMREGESYSALTILCGKDKDYAEEHEDVVGALLSVRVNKLESEK